MVSNLQSNSNPIEMIIFYFDILLSVYKNKKFYNISIIANYKHPYPSPSLQIMSKTSSGCLVKLSSDNFFNSLKSQKGIIFLTTFIYSIKNENSNVCI